MNRTPMTPDQALAELMGRLAPVETQQIAINQAAGRILANSVLADRDSPAADVSAMDGYAIRIQDLQCNDRLSVSGESAPGHAPPKVDPDKVMRVFTGGIVPSDFDLVVRREDTEEAEDSIRLLPAAANSPDGANIRRQGENALHGSQVASAGTLLHPGAIAAAANFGANHVTVARRICVTILVTGDELCAVDASVEPWQLRDSNGPTLNAMLATRPWIDVLQIERVIDSKEQLGQRLAAAVESSDAVILTGGVSMGDYDYVPDAIASSGGEVIFHRLPIRPGKPILGAVAAAGTPIIGLPGNPVSAAVGCRRFVIPLLARLGGIQEPDSRPRVYLNDPGERTLPLHWMRLVTIGTDGNANLVPSKGSGDLVSLAASDGFVEQPPESKGAGPWPFWNWSSI